MNIYHRRLLPAIATRWDLRAATWDEQLHDPDCHLNEDEAYQRFLRCLRREIKIRRPFCASHGVIDAGCGTGLVLHEVAPFFAWGAGVDISLAMIRAAKRKRIPNTRFVVADCFQLANLLPPAGAVISRGVLLSHYGVRHGLSLLRAARRALVPGGFILFDFLNARGRAGSAHVPETKRWFTAAEVRALACRAGLVQIQLLSQSNLRVRLLLAQAPLNSV